MTDQTAITPQQIIDFWFPDGPDPDPGPHMDLWMRRMRGGTDQDILAKYTDMTERAAQGEFEIWAETPLGRLALIILLDQFPRTVWVGSPKAYAQDPKDLALCLAGLGNGHFKALENVWYQSVFKLPLEHCECPDHLANLDRAVMIADQIAEEAPEKLKAVYAFAAQQPRKHREVIARFGRHPHRNAILGRASTAEEQDYLAKGEFPHQTDLRQMLKPPDAQTPRCSNPMCERHLGQRFLAASGPHCR